MATQTVLNAIAAMNSNPDDPDALVKLFQLTKTLRRDVYEPVDPKNPKNNAAGKSVLITGGGYGIGKGIALTWARAGASVIIIAGRKKEKLEETAAEIRNEAPETRALTVQFDLTDESSIESLFEQVKQEIGQLDVLICNAFEVSWQKAGSKIGEHERSADWWEVIETNAGGTYRTIHHYIRTFGTSGTIISLNSIASPAIAPGETAYSLSKRLLASLIEIVHQEHSSLRVFSLSPGLVVTGAMGDPMKPYALDTPELAGGVSLYMACGRMEYARGRFVGVGWDVDEMEQHKDEIVEEDLLKFGFIKAKLGDGGHPWKK